VRELTFAERLENHSVRGKVFACPSRACTDQNAFWSSLGVAVTAVERGENISNNLIDSRSENLMLYASVSLSRSLSFSYMPLSLSLSLSFSLSLSATLLLSLLISLLVLAFYFPEMRG